MFVLRKNIDCFRRELAYNIETLDTYMALVVKNPPADEET